MCGHFVLFTLRFVYFLMSLVRLRLWPCQVPYWYDVNDWLPFNLIPKQIIQTTYYFVFPNSWYVIIINCKSRVRYEHYSFMEWLSHIEMGFLAKTVLIRRQVFKKVGSKFINQFQNTKRVQTYLFHYEVQRCIEASKY